MKLIIDRFEDDFAVVELESGQMINCPKAMLPDTAKEGSILIITVDNDATNKKLQENTNRMNRLFRD